MNLRGFDHPFQIGDRVKISPEYHWAKSSTGTISSVSEVIAQLEPSWEGHARKVQMVHGIEIFYWVSFDVPQIDNEGDGPYREAEIDSRYLILVDRDQSAG